MESNKRYNASFNALLFLSEATKGNNYEHEPIAVPNKIVKSKFVFDILQEIYKYNLAPITVSMSTVMSISFYHTNKQNNAISHLTI